MITALFRIVMQRVVVIHYRRFGAIFRSIFKVKKKRWDRQRVPKRRLGITTTSCVIVHVSSSPHNRIIINSPKTPLNAAISIWSSPMESGDGFAPQFESGHLIHMWTDDLFRNTGNSVKSVVTKLWAVSYWASMTMVSNNQASKTLHRG
jgi:hypothetical protein